jgi:hypothetical protein
MIVVVRFAHIDRGVLVVDFSLNISSYSYLYFSLQNVRLIVEYCISATPS